ncbi:MAG: penicillin-binding protein 2 [Patescibacteria group bacterium]|jgi:cell division protein FtsI/penicillin-binding protein 2
MAARFGTPPPEKRGSNSVRLRVVKTGVLLVVAAIVLRLWQLQVIDHAAYAQLSLGQQATYELLTPERGKIFATQRGASGGEELVPLAVNRDAYFIFANPRLIEDPKAAAEALAGPLKKSVDELLPLLDKPDDPYAPLLHRAGADVAAAIRALNLPGIQMITERERFYPNNNVGSHVLGFVSYKDDKLVGQYGIEGTLNSKLAGTAGSIQSIQSPGGVWITLGDRDVKEAVDGSSVVLTIDWTVQFYACRALDAWVAKHGATGGSVIVMNPATGAIIAMCGSPDFNPNVFNETEKITAFNNPALFLNYEPGSVMKGLTMAAAIDQQRVTPTSTYVDTGSVTFGRSVIKNSDNKAHGVQTMTQVLEESLNTGAIYAMRQVGLSVFKKYLEDFGLGSVTGIDLEGEAAGNLKSLYQNNEIYAATASFGQGVTATPLQMVAAYAAIANNGKLMQPYLVQEVKHPDGSVETHSSKTVRQVINQRTSAQISGMLARVVTNGHGKKAAVPGYVIAGKTGTAQIPRKDGKGYESGSTIGSFIGYGPVSNPKFAMLVRIDRPQDVQFAESSAAPLFGDLAKFILQYYEVPFDNIK